MPLFHRRRPMAGPDTLPVDEAQGDPDAQRLLVAIRSGYWPAAREVLAGAPDGDALSFLIDIGAAVPGTETWLPDVVRTELDCTLAPLLSGARMIAWAWEARGHQWARHVGADQFELFFERLRMAEDCLQGVVRREPDNAAAWHQLVTTARGLQRGVDEARRRFDQAVTACPGHLGAHQQMLRMLCAKWYGSHEQAHEFARTTMLAEPPGSPLGFLVAISHFEHAAYLDTSKATKRYLRSRAVRAELNEAADRSVRHPDYRPGRHDAAVRGTFALVFTFAGEYKAAAEQFRAVGDRVTDFPWCHVGSSPGSGFCAVRKRAYARA